MNTTKLLIIVAFPLSAIAQLIQPSEKVYIVEGIIANAETLEILPSAIMYNDSLGIITTSDERGYYKIVVPYKLISNRSMIPIDVIKTGYKRCGWGIMFNPNEPHSITDKNLQLIWNYDVQILFLAKNEAQLKSTSLAHISAMPGIHGYDVIKATFQNAMFSTVRERKLEALKKGNNYIYFKVDKQIVFSSDLSTIYLYEKSINVYIGDKKVKLNHLNKLLNRHKATINWPKSDSLSEKFKKRTVVFDSNNFIPKI